MILGGKNLNDPTFSCAEPGISSSSTDLEHNRPVTTGVGSSSDHIHTGPTKASETKVGQALLDSKVILKDKKKLSFLGAHPVPFIAPQKNMNDDETDHQDPITSNNTVLRSEANDAIIVPLPSMQRNMTYRQTTITPGAYPHGDNINNNGNITNSDEETALVVRSYHNITEQGQESSTISQAAAENLGLAVASPVNETEEQYHLPQAEGIDATTAAQSRRASKTKWFKTKVSLVAILFIAILVIGVSVLVKQQNSTNDEVSPTISPSSTSNSPSQAPSSEEDSILSLLPEVTIQAINNASNAPDAPQVKAFQWLMEEKDYFPFLADYRIQQRFALAAFYFSTNGDTWKNNTNWLHHSIHECLWFSSMDEWYMYSGHPTYYQIEHPNPCELTQSPSTFVSDGIVQHIWLVSNGLSGDWAPPELCLLLTELKSFALFWGYEFAPRSIPSSIAGLQKLKMLSISGTGLTGTIPSELGNLNNLKVLDIGINALTGSIPSTLYSMTQLESFLVLGSLLTGTFPTELGLLTNAKLMGVAHTLLTGQIPSELGKLSYVEWMLLRTMPFVTGQIPSQLAELHKMWIFEVEASSLTGTIPTWFGGLKSLRHLTLNKNSFTGTIPSEIGLLTNNFGLPGVLALDDNKLTGTIPSELGNLGHVTSFTLYGNNFISTIPTELGRLTGVVELFLENTGLIGTIPSELGRLSHAKKVRLDGNSLTGFVPVELSSLSLNGSIQVLFVQDNNLSGVFPEDLCNVTQVTFDCSESLCGCDWCRCSLNSWGDDWAYEAPLNNTM